MLELLFNWIESKVAPVWNEFWCAKSPYPTPENVQIVSPVLLLIHTLPGVDAADWPSTTKEASWNVTLRSMSICNNDEVLFPSDVTVIEFAPPANVLTCVVPLAKDCGTKKIGVRNKTTRMRVFLFIRVSCIMPPIRGQHKPLLQIDD